MRDRVKIIVNPVSGKGGALRRAEEVATALRALGCEVDLQQTTQGGDARRLAGESRGFSAVAATGGDGTVNEVLNGLPIDGAGGSPSLAMIPSGTANVLAKELRLPRKADQLAQLLRQGNEAVWDLGVDRASGRRFLLFASAGYDAHVVHLFHAVRTGPIRMWQYLYWGLKSILKYDVPKITVELDGQKMGDDVAWVLVSQVACYGGPLVFTAHARPGRGTFEVMIQRGRSRWDVAKIFWSAALAWLFGGSCKAPDVTFHAAKRITLTSSDGRTVPLQVDGDPGGQLPAELEIVPGAIRIAAP
ncbi:MAG TPA: diacylglycerol kinase family protein [Planctomycetota bacterium]|nr:diacylglycerol kinase family protein [Planctomycetota bacterium]